MNALLFLLRLSGVVLALIAALVLASDFIPLDGFRLGEWVSADGDHMYFKAVPTGDRANARLFAFLVAVASAICFTLPSLIKNYVNQNRAE